MATKLPAPITAEDCAAALMETIHPIMQFIRGEMRSQREPSLSVPQFRILAFLSRHPGASLSQVADHLGISRATASTMTERLVQKGWVDRAEDPQERRQVMLRLTQTGSDHLHQIREVTRQKIALQFDDLSLEELTELATGLAVLNRVFAATHVAQAED